MIQESPSKEPDETQEYIAIADRIRQDVWHDNFVPKYSALATAEPSWLFIVGIWLLFSPQIFFTTVALVYGRRNNITDIVMDVAALLYSLLLVTILLVQTRRFIRARREGNGEGTWFPNELTSEQDEERGARRQATDDLPS